jgi:hypothetical protein
VNAPEYLWRPLVTPEAATGKLIADPVRIGVDLLAGDQVGEIEMLVAAGALVGLGQGPLLAFAPPAALDRC